MPGIDYNPTDVLLFADLDDLGIAGGALGTALFIAPFNCWSPWIGATKSFVGATNPTFLSLEHEDGREVADVLEIPLGGAAAIGHSAEISSGSVNNYWRAGETIKVVSDGGTTTVGPTLSIITLVLRQA